MASTGGPPENDTIRDLILPTVAAAGWTSEQITREYWLRAQRVVSLGNASRTLGDGFADIVLEAMPGTPVAVIEAKRRYRSADDAIQQAIRYAQQLDVPLAYGANGLTIIERNLRTGVERKVSAIAAPALAWDEYARLHNLDEDGLRLLGQPLNRKKRTAAGDVITPRPYQVLAINRVLTAIARKRKRVLLLMATGTGKTFTAMQIVAKLRAYESAIRPERNYRVLYLADRDQLLKDPHHKWFAEAFGTDPLRRVLGGVDTSRELYFASYQALSGDNPDARKALAGDSTLLRTFRPDFFDLVIVDECHRGSAQETSSWRKVLDYFSSAVQLGLTATPLQEPRLTSASTNPSSESSLAPQTVRQISYEYFGNPVFTYSLRQGIEEGYLAPYRVRRVSLSPDADGWQPAEGEKDRFGKDIPSGIYTTRDFERMVSLLARTQLAARHLSKILRRNPRHRAIVFCVDVEHATDMRRALVEENPDLVAADPEWVVRIVGIEGEKERLLEDFTDPERETPVIATTSRLLSTGVDIQDLRYVVLFRPIGSMTEFKQIVGRGTRLYPSQGKYSFEVVDYVGASKHFSDPKFDGYPPAVINVEVDDDGYEVATDIENTDSGDTHSSGFTGGDDFEDAEPQEPLPPADSSSDDPAGQRPAASRRKVYVDSGDFLVGAEAVLVPSSDDGHLILTEYGQFVSDHVRLVARDATSMERTWASAESRQQLIRALLDAHIDIGEIIESLGVPDADPLDALMHVAWDMPVRTRAERARKVRQARAVEMAAMSERARTVLEALLQRYERYGVDDISSPQVYKLEPLSQIGSPTELAKDAGGAAQLRDRLRLVQEWLYSS